MPALAEGKTAPTARNLDCTAIPHSPVRLSRATIENVIGFASRLSLLGRAIIARQEYAKYVQGCCKIGNTTRACRSAEGDSPLPEREVSSLHPSFPLQAARLGGRRATVFSLSSFVPR